MGECGLFRQFAAGFLFISKMVEGGEDVLRNPAFNPALGIGGYERKPCLQK